MREDKKAVCLTIPWYQGSPPHARGQDISFLTEYMVPGITPACAGTSVYVILNNG